MPATQQHPIATPNNYPLVLVTGGTGWLGRRLVQALTLGGIDTGLPGGFSGHPVRCLVPDDAPAAALDDFGVEVVRGDLADGAALDRFFDGAQGALLLHLAGVIHPPATDTGVWRRVNLDGTRNLGGRARLHGVKRFCVMSSNSPMGTNPDARTLFTEDSPYRPYMGYGKSKHAMELYLRGELMGTGGPEVTILRAPWFYGPGQPPRQTRFFHMIRDGKFPIFSGGTNLRSMGYVDNLAQGTMLAAFLPEGADEVFWIADEDPYPMHLVVETVADLLKNEFGCGEVPHWRGYPGLIPDVARLVDATMQAVGLYHQSIHVLSEMNVHIACSVDKAKRVLGYRPRVALREGMRRSIRWCLDNGISI